MTPGRSQRGVALLIVLVLIVLLTSLLTEVAYSTLVDLRLTETFRDSTRAYYLARGGVNAGRMLLQDDRNGYDSRLETWGEGIDNYPVGDGAVTIRIEDLDGKLAVNTLVDGNNPQTVVVDRFHRLFQVLGVERFADPAELTAALIDWLDSGDEPYREMNSDGVPLPVSGAEDLYYRSLATPYACKNGPLETLEELLLVRGFSREVLDLVAPHLAVSGRVRVNINTASAEVLMALSPSIDAATAALLLERRTAAPIAAVSELEDLLTKEAYSALKSLANQKALGTTSAFYRITAHARINDGSRVLVAEVDKLDNSLLFIKVD